MTIETISRIVKELKHKYHEDDPFRLCKAMGIKIEYIPMGRGSDDCKGFFIKKARIRMIVLNADLPEETLRVVLIHELGHAVLHSDISAACFHDFVLLDNTSMYEYEANMFAAEFIMDDDDVLARLMEGISFFNAAQELCVPPELLDFKFRVLKRRGYAINPPLYAQSCFMRDVDRADRF